MCGIAGIYRTGGTATAADEAMVVRQLAAERHRGPDAEGLLRRGAFVFGHRRLAIIDLSELGRQPMANETGDVWITFNGEIYNYRELGGELKAAGHTFRSLSDTEVILHGYEEWGIDGLLSRLRGMFAFALYDERIERREDDRAPRFFLVRDRLGIKPVYYHEGQGRLSFASEVKALRASGVSAGEPDTVALTGFLALGSVPAPRTMYRDVRCLPPGHYLAAGRAGVVLREFWNFSYAAGAEQVDAPALLADTVDRHLLSDVPLGVFLSGGVDSAGIAAMAMRVRQSPVLTLTITFEEEEFSEAAPAREFARAFGTDHHEIMVRSGDFMTELPNIFAAMDQPTADGVNTYFVSRAARQAGLTVVLSGLGGDEVFFGYPHYHRYGRRKQLLEQYSGLPGGLRRAAVAAASAYGSMRGQERWRRFSYLNGRPAAEGFYLLARGFYPPAEVARLLGVDSAAVSAAIEESFEAVRGGAPKGNGGADLNRISYFEMKRYLHDQLLRDSDVFSMAHSLELRVPYLDHKMVEYGCSLAPEAKLGGGMNKPRLVEAIGHPLVTEAARRKKQGFTFPFAAWMQRHAGELEARTLDHKMLDAAAVRRGWSEFRAGRMHWSRAWAMVVTGVAASSASQQEVYAHS